MSQNYINHIALVLDESSSMERLAREVVKVADNQIAYLAQRSKELDQETRVTVYTFADHHKIRCVFYDKDVLRMPSLAGVYKPYGSTALVDATAKAIDDLAKTPELYGDHAFLVYVLTDGQENNSRTSGSALTKIIGGLADNWTVAAFVPDANGKFEAKKFGFPADNIAIWDTNAKGLAEVGETIRQTTETFMTNRAVGVRGSKNLFNMAPVSKQAVQAVVTTALHPGQYRLAPVKADGPISAFVEDLTHRPYRLGEAYYQLSKTEKIQPQKSIAIFDKKTRAVYTGPEARRVLGLPNHEVKVKPDYNPDLEIFVQSTSVNRKLIAGTNLLLLS